MPLGRSLGISPNLLLDLQLDPSRRSRSVSFGHPKGLAQLTEIILMPWAHNRHTVLDILQLGVTERCT
jgi:hypothetical protein